MNINKLKIALIFPGQGSQHIGMGENICQNYQDSNNAFQIINKYCDFDLNKVAWQGPEDALNRTLYTQPALYATSVACMQALRQYWPENPLCVAGHSLGEFSALWAAGVFSVEEGAQLTTYRAILMNQAPEGSMSAILGGDAEQLEHIINTYQQEHNCALVIANYNSPQQKVISGDKNHILIINQVLSEAGYKVIALPVSGAFHSPLMQEANQKYQELINTINFREPDCPIIQNVTAQAHTQVNIIKNNISQQMISSVKWEQSIHTMLSMGAECFIEIGSGKVLSGLIKKIDRNINVLQINDKNSLEDTLNKLNIN